MTKYFCNVWLSKVDSRPPFLSDNILSEQGGGSSDYASYYYTTITNIVLDTTYKTILLPAIIFILVFSYIHLLCLFVS